MKVLYTAALSLIALAFFSISPFVNAQSYMDEPGIPTFTTAFPVEHGFINIANGALHLEIPIASYPQRGSKLQYHARLVYDSRFWTFDPNADDSPSGWQPNGVSGDPQPLGVGWRLITGGEAGNPSSTTKLMLQCNSGAGGQIGPFYKTLYSNFRYQEGDGTVHPFAGIPTLTQNNATCGIGGGNGTASALASDNSGFRMNVSNFVITAVYAPDGSQVYPRAQDTNGNFMSDSFQQVPNVGYIEHIVDTLAREPVIGSFSGNPVTQVFFDFLNPQGSRSRVTVNLAPINLATNFGTGGDYTGANVVVQSIVFPDSTSYQFQYDSYGQITTMTLPTGGQVTYGYTNTTAPNVVNRWLTSRTLAGNTWTFTPVFTSCTAPCNPLTVTVATPPYNDGTSTANENHVYSFFFSSPKGGGGAWPAQIQYFRGPTTGIPLLTLTKDYNNGSNNPCQQPMGAAGTPLLIRETLSWPSGSGTLSKKMEYCYDTSGVNIIAKKMWDYQANGNFPAAPDREVDTTYVTDPAYVNANILTLPLTVTSFGPGSAQVAKTTDGYDGGTLQTSNITTQHVTPAGPRGNLTSLSKWLNTTNGNITSNTSWFDTGEVYQSTDPGGHPTTFSYDSAFAGAYATQQCNALSQCAYKNYDFNTGLLLSSTDINGSSAGDSLHTSTHTYDSMLRPLCTNAPDGGQTCLSYPSATTTTTTTKIQSGLPNDIFSIIRDGLGRTIQTQHVTPACTVKVDTTYDSLSRVSSVSNQYCTVSDPTYGTIQTIYDGLSRVIKVTEQDGSVATTQFGAISSMNAMCVTNTDEAGKQRRLCSNGFGELLEVDEPGDSFSGTQATGSLPVNGTLQSRSGVGATNPTPGSGSLTITGAENSTTTDPCSDQQPPNGGPPPSCPQTIWDSGSVTIMVNGHADSASYGMSDTTASVATDLANAINNDTAAFVYASASNGVLTLQARSAGAATNYSWSITSASSDPGDFGTAGSFSSSPMSGALSGGTNGSGGITVYDAGTVTVTIGSFQASVSYSQTTNSTASAVASALAAALNAGASPVTASASGSNINLTDKTVGAAGNVSVTCNSSTSQTSYFSGPSFTCAGITLSGGFNPEGPSLDFNYFVTQYGYDGLGNLVSVTQKGDPAVNSSNQWRLRNFTYDSLSRLLIATNPESGTINYTYDPDDNVVQKASPQANQTGTATTTFTYCFDALHRLLAKGFVNSPSSPQQCATTAPWLATPTVVNTYDQGTNGKGHLTSLSDLAGGASYTFDNIGRIKSESRSLNGVPTPKTMAYDYNLDGSLKALTYPSNSVITYAPWNSGSAAVNSPQEAKDLGNNINYVTGATYGPDGSLIGFVNGSGGPASITSTLLYNNRLQLCRLAASSTGAVPTSCTNSFGNILDLNYDFHWGNGDNGIVYGITNFRDQSRNQTFTYDPLNRLVSAQNAGTDCSVPVLHNKTKFWGNNYVYDPWGNLLQKNITKCGAEYLIATADVQNRIHTNAPDYQYDAAGNMTNDPTDSVAAVFDAENRISAITQNGITTNYSYDADGNRVAKTNGTAPSSGTLYWYMSPGVVAESDLAGTLKSEYIFFQGERAARKDLPGNSVAYYFSDRLKTATVIADASANIKSESDYYPWGGELSFVANDSNHYKFTGKERDAESGFDYFGARYYSNGLGRWISADWSPTPIAVPYADLTDPQTLNLYAYVRDIPTSRADADGHGIVNRIKCFFGDKDACAAQAKEDEEERKKAEQEKKEKEKKEHARRVRIARFYAAEYAKICKCQFDPSKFSDDQILWLFENGSFSLTKDDPLDPLQLFGIVTVVPGGSKWTYGNHKSAQKWRNQMQQRGWTEQQIDEAIATGQKFPAPNNVNPANGATRYVNPTTGRSVVVDNVTGELLHVGGDGFRY